MLAFNFTCLRLRWYVPNFQHAFVALKLIQSWWWEILQFEYYTFAFDAKEIYGWMGMCTCLARSSEFV